MRKMLTNSKLFALSGIFLMLFFRFSLIPYFIAFLVLCSLFTIDYKNTSKKWNQYLSLLVALFLINAISLFYSTNLKFGLQTIETQITLIVFPLLIYFDQDFYYSERRKINTLFIYSALISIIAFIAIFIYNGKLIEIINFTGEYDIYSVLRYHKITAGQHPSYISLGYLLAIILIWQSLKETKNKFYFATKSLVILFILAFIFILNARAVFIAALLVVVYFAVKYMSEHKLVYKLIIISVLIIGFVFLIRNTRFKNVFVNLKNADNIEQVDLRFSLWHNAIIAWQEKPLFGYGIGDGKEAIASIHKQRNIEEAVEYNLNAHNQFLETLIQTGLVGFIILITVFLLALSQSIIIKEELTFLFFLICFVSFFFESMIQRLTGVVFFAFWYSFLTIINYREDSISSTLH